MRSVGVGKWIGWALSTAVSILLIFSASMKFAGGSELEQGMNHLGLALNLVSTIGFIEIACTVIYLIPRTSILGAILVTGYMGGAILAHLRVGDPVLTQVMVGVIAWAGVYLREPRLWVLLPIKR